MCVNDPYHGRDNIAVHEFAHTIDRFGFNATMDRMQDEAYEFAKAHNLWRLSAYSMSSTSEYFGEATGAFFLVNKQSSPGGMNKCSEEDYCSTEMEARHHIRRIDRRLYDLLVLVYTSNRPQLPSGLSVCPPEPDTIG